MVDGLTAALIARVPASSWTDSSSAGEAVRSVAVLRFDEDRKALVLTASGRWAWTSIDRDGKDILHELRLPDAVGVLPVLELDPAGLEVKLAAVAALLGTSPGELVVALPGTDLLDVAFETRSDYWIACALRWMDALPRWSARAALMQAVVNDPTVSQRNRHRARKLLATRED